ncbi:helix-turn-helix domain-containing protein [Nanchangia anserum]|uniref:Helix-turn-helix domain-containing protein n=1 Tax=Nanchangia anserum TaxID=2692125 RepID=A0A8I0G8D5_9ACTO|nr:helix-turn-helix domain-containing protein [Nanchangia anserum]MBD3689747.1 helix-turn-helix domain-containing protein [Nanchangia anserum]QOX81916.1 helix-turn-helix domain-containing protein [Nanchangia anserum]
MRGEDSGSLQLCTASEVAQRLGQSPATVRRWARKGYVPSMRTPTGRLFFRASDIDDMLTSAGAGYGKDCHHDLD